MTFFPNNKQLYIKAKALLNELIEELGFVLIGCRKVPVDETIPGSSALEVMPIIEQVFVQHKEGLQGIDLERKLYVLRNYSSSKITASTARLSPSAALILAMISGGVARGRPMPRLLAKSKSGMDSPTAGMFGAAGSVAFGPLVDE